MSIFIILPIISLSISAFACDCAHTPIIYIKGRTNIYKTTDDNSDANLAETNVSGGARSVVESVAHILPYLNYALLTDKWDKYSDVLYEEIIPMYDKYHLNNDGEIDNGSGIYEFWSPEKMIARVKAAGPDAHIQRYADITNTQFQYDMRLDPCVVAQQLRQYIEAIKEVSGHDKVNIVARCEGTVIANAYFNLYDHDDIDKVIVYNSIACGAEIADEIYTNQMTLDDAAVNRFVEQYLDTTPVKELIKASVNAYYAGKQMRPALNFIEYVFHKISANFLPRLIRDTFGTCPGWWGMVSPEAFEEAKAFVLGENTDGTYDKLIEKIDRYNYNYKIHAADVLQQMQDEGVKVYIFAKYGTQMYPVIESTELMGDGVVSIYKQTFNGATASTLTETLSDAYIAERTDAGFGGYISADRKIDASTSPFCAHTWFFKEMTHATLSAHR